MSNGGGVPGTWLLEVIARLLPPHRRLEWLAEWRSELANMFAEGVDKGRSAGGLALRMYRRAIGATSDALYLRRTDGGRVQRVHVVTGLTRLLRRQPAFAAMVVTTLALGIAVATAIFSVLDGLLLRPLPFAQADRLVEVHRLHNGESEAFLDPERAEEWPRHTSVFEAAHAYTDRSAVITGPGEPRQILLIVARPGFLRLLGFDPLIGRDFAADETTPGRDRVILLGHEVWRTQFGGDRSVIGSTIHIDETPHTVIGILPPALRVLPSGRVEGIVPLRDPLPANVQVYEMLGRLRPGLDVATAQSRLAAVAATLDRERPREEGWGVFIDPLGRHMQSDTRAALIVLGCGAAFLLLVACVNAAGLLFVRSVHRRREMAIRGALGAGRLRLFGEVLVESIGLAALSGIAGTVAASWFVRGLVAIGPQLTLEYSYTAVRMDGRALLFALVLTFATGLVFSALPALRASGFSAIRASDRASTWSRSQARTRSFVQTLQIALAVILLVGAGLLGRSFRNLVTVDPGFDTRNLLVLENFLTSSRYAEESARSAFNRELDERLRSIPGVRDVTWTTGGIPPYAGFRLGYTIERDDGTLRPGGDQYLPMASVDTAYFRVMGIPILQGTAFGASPAAPGERYVIIDVDLAEALFPDGSAAGRRFRFNERDPWHRVIGVSGDVKLRGPDDRRSRFALFYPLDIDRLRSARIGIRIDGSTPAIATAILAAFRAVDPAQPISRLSTAEQALGDSVQQQRFLTLLLSVFAVAALLLATVGVYGLIAFTVEQRRREFGIRIAVGATSAAIVSFVFARGMLIALAGLLIGGVGALALSRFIRGLLFGTSPGDPLTMLGVAAVLAIATALALFVPARRASRVDPAVALRAE